MMRKSLLAIGALSLAVAGCAAPPQPIKPSPFHFWNRLGEASRSVSQIFDDGNTTYVLPKVEAPITGIQVPGEGERYAPVKLTLDGAYYTFPGVYAALRVDTPSGDYVVSNPSPAVATSPAAPSDVKSDPVTGQSKQHVATRTPAVATPPAVMPSVTIGQLFMASSGAVDARVSSGILGTRLRDLIAMLPSDWTVMQGAGVPLDAHVSVYLNQSVSDAVKSACGQVHATCSIDPQKKAIVMEAAK